MAQWSETRGFLPGRVLLDAYGNGGFRFAGMSHQGSVICLPSGIYAWEVRQAAEVDAASLARVFGENGVDVLLAGMGPDWAPLPPDVMEMARARGMVADSMTTAAAARTYNVMAGDGRAVAAALIAVDDAR